MSGCNSLVAQEVVNYLKGLAAGNEGNAWCEKFEASGTVANFLFKIRCRHVICSGIVLYDVTGDVKGDSIDLTRPDSYTDVKICFEIKHVGKICVSIKEIIYIILSVAKDARAFALEIDLSDDDIDRLIKAAKGE